MLARSSGMDFQEIKNQTSGDSGRMTTHYSAAELTKIIEAVNSVCERNGNRPELVVLRRLGVS
jgi:hypothetical protein